MHWRRRRLSGLRAVSPIIAALLLTAITIACGVVLWSLRIHTPTVGVQIDYVAEGDQTEPAWGDPTDCSNDTIYASCDGLPAFFIVFTAHSPQNIPLVDLDFEMLCNHTSLLNGTFAAMEVIPGTGANPGTGAPALGQCGTWHPSKSGTTATYFNRLAYFEQIVPGTTVLHDGDIFVVYEHPLANFCDRNGNCPDDDYHGAPPWCFTSQSADCEIQIAYTGNPATIVAVIPIIDIGG